MDATRLSLLQRLRNPADNVAWGEFLRIYEPLLTSYVRSRNVPDHEAASVVQNVIVTLWRTLPTFQLDKQRGRFRTWLFQVTVNAVTDHFRRKQRIGKHEIGMAEDAPEPAVVDPSPDANWDREFEQRLYHVALEQVRAQSNETTWTCFEKYTLGNRSAEDVAAELGMLPNTVRKNASRILARIREVVQQHIEEMES